MDILSIQTGERIGFIKIHGQSHTYACFEVKMTVSDLVIRLKCRKFLLKKQRFMSLKTVKIIIKIVEFKIFKFNK